MKPKRRSVYALAKRLRVPAARINDIALEKPGTGDSGAVVPCFFGTTELLWLNLQGAYVINSAELYPVEPLRSGEVGDLNSG